MTLNLFHTEAVLQGDVLPHSTQSIVPPDQVRDHPNTVWEASHLHWRVLVSSTATLALRLLKIRLTFQPWADCLVIAVSPNQSPHHPYCHMSPNGRPIRQGYISIPSVSRELSLFCPPSWRNSKAGRLHFGCRPSLTARHCLQFSQPKVLFKWLWRLFYIL